MYAVILTARLVVKADHASMVARLIGYLFLPRSWIVAVAHEIESVEEIDEDSGKVWVKEIEEEAQK
jgi:hypothetical protein